MTGYAQVPIELIASKDLDSAAIRLGCLLYAAAEEEGVVRLANEDLVKTFEIPLRTLQRRLADLERFGFVARDGAANARAGIVLLHWPSGGRAKFGTLNINECATDGTPHAKSGAPHATDGTLSGFGVPNLAPLPVPPPVPPLASPSYPPPGGATTAPAAAQAGAGKRTRESYPPSTEAELADLERLANKTANTVYIQDVRRLGKLYPYLGMRWWMRLAEISGVEPRKLTSHLEGCIKTWERKGCPPEWESDPEPKPVGQFVRPGPALRSMAGVSAARLAEMMTNGGDDR